MVLRQVNIAAMCWNRIKIYLILLPCFGLLFCSCGHQVPQRPSQRKGQEVQVDSTALALMELNQQLAMSADKQLAAFVKTQEETYAFYDANTWVTILNHGDENSAMPKSGEEWVIRMHTYDLEGNLLLDSEGTYCIGKQELPLAVEANIHEWHRGAKIRLVAPWYAAYGLKGTKEIPPYENIIIDLELK